MQKTKIFRSYWPGLGFFTLLLLIISSVYRLGLPDFPREDQFLFLKEHEFSNTNLEFFIRSLSYNRAAYVAQGDFFLFRPVFFGFLAVISIFFREHLYFSGFISFALHAMTSFMLYQLIRSKVSMRWLPGLIAVLFSIQYAGMEMVVWRHINPYMLGLSAFIGGMLLFTKQGSVKFESSRLIAVYVLLLIAALTHESFAFSLLILGLMSLYLGKRTIAATMLGVWIAWTVISVADFIYYCPGDLFGGDAMSPYLNATTALSIIFLLTGLFVSVFVLPGMVHLQYDRFFISRASWDLSTLPFFLIFFIGTVFMLVLLLWIFSLVREEKRHDSEPAINLSLVVGIYFLVLLIGFGFGRLIVRTIEYLRTATYYYYFSNFFLFYFLSVLLSKIHNQKKVLGWLIPLYVFYLSFNFNRIQAVLSERNQHDQRVAQLVSSLNKDFSKRPEHCYGGAIGGTLDQIMASGILLNQSCLRKSGIPLYMSPTVSDEKIVLSELIRPKLGSRLIELNETAFEHYPTLISYIDSGYPAFPEPPAFLSKFSVNALEITVEMPRLGWSGLVIGYQDPNNFMALHSHRGQLLIFMKRSGEIWSRVYRNKLISKNGRIRLSVKQISPNRMIIFCNEQAIEIFPTENLLSGRIGLYTNETQLFDGYFSNLTVVDAVTDPSDGFFLKTISEISVPTGRETQT